MDFDGFGSGDSSLAFGQMTLAFRPRNMPLQKANKDGEVLDENMDDGNQQDIEAPDHTLPAPPPQGASSEIGDKKDEKPVVTVNHGNGSRIQQRRACIARKIQKIMGLRPCVKGRGFYSQDILLFTELHLADPMLLWVDQVCDHNQGVKT